MTGDQPIENEEFVPRENDIFGMDLCTSTFDNLLGSHLGEWKIILSAQAMKDLRDSVDDGNIPRTLTWRLPRSLTPKLGDSDRIQKKLYELASGEWAGKSILIPSKLENGSSFRIPLFRAIYKKGSLILWQVDIAYDERYNQDSQVVKGLRLRKSDLEFYRFGANL
jgi:hypothetical protein